MRGSRWVKAPEAKAKMVEKVNQTFVEYALLVHDRWLADPDLRAVFQDVDHRYGQAFFLSVCGMREIVRVGKSAKYIAWLLHTVKDLLDANVFSWRDLGVRAPTLELKDPNHIQA